MSKTTKHPKLTCQRCNYIWEYRGAADYPQCPRCRTSVKNPAHLTITQEQALRKCMSILQRAIEDGTLSGFTVFGLDYPSRPLPPELREKVLEYAKQLVNKHGVEASLLNIQASEKSAPNSNKQSKEASNEKQSVEITKEASKKEA